MSTPEGVRDLAGHLDRHVFLRGHGGASGTGRTSVVRTIAESHGVRMPSFFGYLAWALRAAAAGAGGAVAAVHPVGAGPMRETPRGRPTSTWSRNRRQLGRRARPRRGRGWCRARGARAGRADGLRAYAGIQVRRAGTGRGDREAVRRRRARVRVSGRRARPNLFRRLFSEALPRRSCPRTSF